MREGVRGTGEREERRERLVRGMGEGRVGGGGTRRRGNTWSVILKLCYII